MATKKATTTDTGDGSVPGGMSESERKVRERLADEEREVREAAQRAEEWLREVKREDHTLYRSVAAFEALNHEERRRAEQRIRVGRLSDGTLIELHVARHYLQAFDMVAEAELERRLDAGSHRQALQVIGRAARP